MINSKNTYVNNEKGILMTHKPEKAPKSPEISTSHGQLGKKHQAISKNCLMK